MCYNIGEVRESGLGVSRRCKKNSEVRKNLRKKQPTNGYISASSSKTRRETPIVVILTMRLPLRNIQFLPNLSLLQKIFYLGVGVLEKITEEELVERFGNDAQKEKYKKEGKLVSSNKQGVMSRASKYCVVTPIGKKMYKLTQQKKMPIMANSRMANGVYPYTCPLIIEYLLNSKIKDKVILGRMSLAKNIEMVNEYYLAMNGNERMTADEFDLDTKSVYEFFGRVTDSVNRIIKQTLDYLQTLKLIIYKENYIVKWANAVPCGYTFEAEIGTTMATDKEMDTYCKAVNRADKATGIVVANERFNSSKAYDWDRCLHEELGKHGISNMFRVYEVYAVDYENCRLFRDQFLDNDYLMKELGKEFKHNIYNNVLKRIEKNPERYQGYSDDLLFAYRFLSKICIGNPEGKLTEKQKLKADKIVDLKECQTYGLNVKEITEWQKK